MIARSGVVHFRGRELFFSGFGLTVAAVLFAVGRILYVHRPSHLDEIAAAFGAANLFHGEPQVSHSGNQFTFVKTSDRGYGLYLFDINTSRNTVLFEEDNYLGRHGDQFDLRALPWSPDDSSFLCSIDGNLTVYSTDTNRPSVVVESNSVSEAIWLSTEEIIYLHGQTNLWSARREEDGTWEKHRLLSRSVPIGSLAAMSEDTVIWLENNAVCRVTLGEELSETNVVASTNSATGLPATDGLSLWLDASSLKQSDQSMVMKLTDLSPAKNDAVWNNRPPVFNGTNSTRSLHGKPTIHFASLGSSTNGTGLKTRSRLGITGASPRSIFVVMRRAAKRDMMVSIGDASAKGSLFAVEWTNDLYLPAGGHGADNRIKIASTNWSLLEVVSDGAVQKGYVNGLLRGMAKNHLNTVDKEVEIGLRTATMGKNARAAEGDFAELLIYDRALSFVERKQVEAYLEEKWFGLKQRPAVSDSPYVWFVSPVEGITSFSYSRESGRFLLNCTEGRDGSLWQYDPETASVAKVADGNSIRGEQWLGDGQSAFYLREKRGAIVVRDSLGVETDRALPGANIFWFEMVNDGDQILFLGTPTNQPFPGIWQYDLASKNLKTLIPYSDEPSPFAKYVVMTNIVIKPKAGENLVCTIYRPPGFNPHKKYPLLLGNTFFYDPLYRYQGPCWAPAVANGGAYVAIVERRSWEGGMKNWGQNVMAAYESLTRDLPIDTDRVYLFGASDETIYMESVSTNYPVFWKGLILLNPSGLPDLFHARPSTRRPKILISAGAKDDREDRLKEYQWDLRRAGVAVDYIVHSGEGHHLMGNEAEVERTGAIVHFIFDD